MKRYVFVCAILALAIACSSEPSTPSGTLPDVQNLRVDTAFSKGDTVSLSWDAVDASVDGYHIYFATTIPGSWSEYVTEDTTYMHITTSAGYYQVKASEGLNYSSGFSNQVNTRAETGLNEREMRVNTESNGLVMYDDGTGWGVGCADSADFAQDIFIDTLNNKLYLFSGDANPSLYPGGSETGLCRRGCHGRLAPEPASTEWVDSVQITDFDWVFLKLSNGHYAEIYIDSVFTNGADLLSYEYQTIHLLRLFNIL